MTASEELTRKVENSERDLRRAQVFERLTAPLQAGRVPKAHPKSLKELITPLQVEGHQYVVEWEYLVEGGSHFQHRPGSGLIENRLRQLTVKWRIFMREQRNEVRRNEMKRNEVKRSQDEGMLMSARNMEKD